MKSIIKILLLTAAISIAVPTRITWAQFNLPLNFYSDLAFPMQNIKPPFFPNIEVSILKFGAIGDGIFDNSRSIIDAIDYVSNKGGGTVIIPEGLWLSGPVIFKSNINLKLERGALLLFSKDKSKYPIVETSFEGLDTRRCQSPLSGRNLENIAITGQGVIDGNGDVWRFVKKEKLTDSQWKEIIKSGGVLNEKGTEWYPSESFKLGVQRTKEQNVTKIIDEKDWNDIKDFLRPVMVSFIKCKNVYLEGVTFQNSPAWCIHPLMCENLIISGINVRNPWYSQNGDGIDLESCKNAVLYKCNFDVGDDAICIKSGKDEEGRKRGIPSENLVIKECVVYHGHVGFVIGSEMSGSVRNIDVSNCLFIGTDVGLRFKSNRGRGGVVENIYISDINMINIPNEAILFDLFYGGKAPGEISGVVIIKAQIEIPPVSEKTPAFKNIHINNITCNGAARAMYLNGLPEMNLENINIKNSFFTCAFGADIRESNSIQLENVIINVQSGPIVELYNVKKILLNKVSSKKAGNDILRIEGNNSENIVIRNSRFKKENIQNAVGKEVLFFD